MTFLDSSVIIDMLEGVESTVEAVQNEGEPYLTSSICVFEVVAGELGSGSTDVVGEREEFGGVRALDFSETVALDALGMQDQLISDSNRMPARDLMIAATARSTGDELIVADSDFDHEALRQFLSVRNLA